MFLNSVESKSKKAALKKTKRMIQKKYLFRVSEKEGTLLTYIFFLPLAAGFQNIVNYYKALRACKGMGDLIIQPPAASNVILQRR